MNRPDCWEILGINPTRNLDRIRDAFRKKAKLYHPDSSAHYPFLKEKYNFIEIKPAENEALHIAQSDNLSTTYENSQPGEYEYFYGRSGFSRVHCHSVNCKVCIPPAIWRILTQHGF